MASFERKRIVVIDDNKDLADAFGKLLEIMGQEVRICYTGDAVLKVVAEYTPDIVFLDIGMPDMDGYETVKKLKSLKSLKNTKFIAVTGYGQEEDKRRALEAGFDLHMVKPINVETIEQVLKGEL